jgi:putative ABC transport system permease protein
VNALRQQKDVADVTVGTGLQPGSNTPMATTIIQYPTGGKRELMTNCLFVDERTVPTLDLKLVEGRNLSNDEGDRMGGFLVNEAFIRNVGRSIGIGTGIQAFDHKGKIVGVVRNFNYQSIHNLIQPLVMLYNTGPAESITVKLKTVNVDALKEVWTSYFPDFPFEFSFVEEAFNEQYQSDRSVALLFELFAFMVSFLSFLGLYALLSLNIFRRTKEIGMRKVMGASFPDIFMMLYKDFFTILLVSVLLAAPITWIGMNKWLQNFAYRETIQWSIFLASGLITFIISLVIVDYGIIKVAKRPIVESLHVE